MWSEYSLFLNVWNGGIFSDHSFNGMFEGYIRSDRNR